MKVPSRLVLLGRPVNIRYVPALGDDEYGDSDATKSTITVAIRPHTSQEEVFATLLHEVLHIALNVTGHGSRFKARDEEALVVALENALAPILEFKTRGVRWVDVKFKFDRGYGR